jgi:hypothetical protein
MKYAVVKNNEVTNIVEWDGESDFNPDGELIAATEDTKIGGSWDGNVFTFVTPEPPPDTRTYDEKRKAEYPSIDDLTVALWEAVVEERLASANALEAERQAVKAKYPKP